MFAILRMDVPPNPSGKVRRQKGYAFKPQVKSLSVPAGLLVLASKEISKD